MFTFSASHSVAFLISASFQSHSETSQGVDTLVNRGLVSRTQSKEDRRFVQLELTPEGNALLDSVFQDTRTWLRSILEDFSEEDLEQAIRGMEVLIRMVG